MDQLPNRPMPHPVFNDEADRRRFYARLEGQRLRIISGRLQSLAEELESDRFLNRISGETFRLQYNDATIRNIQEMRSALQQMTNELLNYIDDKVMR